MLESQFTACTWLTGSILKAISGSDGNVRVVWALKVNFRRPMLQNSFLPITDNDSSVADQKCDVMFQDHT